MHFVDINLRKIIGLIYQIPNDKYLTKFKEFCEDFSIF